MTRFLNFLGSLRAENDAINTLTDQLASVRGDLARSIQGSAAWRAKYDEARNTIACLDAELTEAKPLIAYALKRKASLAAYELKRGRG